MCKDRCVQRNSVPGVYFCDVCTVYENIDWPQGGAVRFWIGKDLYFLLFGPVKCVDWHIQHHVFRGSFKISVRLVRLLLRQSVQLHVSGGTELINAISEIIHSNDWQESRCLLVRLTHSDSNSSQGTTSCTWAKMNMYIINSAMYIVKSVNRIISHSQAFHCLS